MPFSEVGTRTCMDAGERHSKPPMPLSMYRGLRDASPLCQEALKVRLETIWGCLYLSRPGPAQRCLILGARLSNADHLHCPWQVAGQYRFNPIHWRTRTHPALDPMAQSQVEVVVVCNPIANTMDCSNRVLLVRYEYLMLPFESVSRSGPAHQHSLSHDMT